MAGTVAVTAQDMARYHSFTMSALKLETPPETTWDFRLGFNTARNRNLAVSYIAGDWMFFLDDDQTFEPKVLLKLLDRNVDIIQALTPMRVPPFGPHAYVWKDNDFQRADPSLVPQTGISAWDGIACGCLLVKRHVFEAIEPPWFEVSGDGRSDDLYFCRKAKNAGFTCHLDSDTRSSHMTITKVSPEYHNGQWGGVLCFGDDSLG